MPCNWQDVPLKLFCQVSTEANSRQGQHQTEREVLQAEFSKKRDALNEEAKINRNALDAESTAHQDRIRKDQEIQLRAILARHKQEISDHNAATEEKLRKAEEEAVKVHKDRLARDKEDEAAIKVKFNERLKQLEEKENRESEELKNLWFHQMDKRVTASPSLNAPQVHSSLSRSLEETPSRPGANAPLNPPDFSPITPRNGSSARASLGPQSALTESQTPSGTSEAPPNRTLLREQPRATPTISASSNGDAADAPSHAVIGTPPSYESSNRAPAPQNASNGPNSSIPSTPNKETPRARPSTPATSTPKPPFGALSSSGPNTPRKELAQATSETQHGGPSNANPPNTPRYVAPVTPIRGSAGPKTHATSTTRLPLEVLSSPGHGNSRSEPAQFLSKTKTDGKSNASKSGTPQDTVPVTPSKTAGRYQPTTPTANTPTPAPEKPQNALPSTSPTECQDTPIRAQRTVSFSDGHPQGANTRLSLETPTFVAVPRNSTMYENEASSATKLADAPRQHSYVADSESPSLILREKRKMSSSHKGSSQTLRPDVYNDHPADSDDASNSAKDRSAKRPKISSSSIPKRASPYSEGNKAGFLLKAIEKALSSRTGEGSPLGKAFAGPRGIPAQGTIGKDQNATSHEIMPTPSALTPSKRSTGVPQPNTIHHGQIKQHSLTPPKTVVASKPVSSRKVPPPQPGRQSIEKHFELDRVSYPSTGNKWFSWRKGEDGKQYKLVLGKNGMYTAFVDGQLGGSEYGAWMINPNSTGKLEFSYEQRLVKVTRMWNNDPKAHIYFGFTHGAKDFVQNIIDRNPKTAWAKLEL